MAYIITRRHMLAVSAAAGGVAIGGIGAHAQGAPRIERLAPELDKIIDISQPINQLADGVGGPNGPAEGPVWWKEGGYLLFSDINGNRRMKYTPGQGTVEFKKPTNGANGLTRDMQGRLVACEGLGRRVVREETDGSTTVIAGSFQGTRQTDHVFADLDGSEPGVPDGMKVDTTGNVYCGGAGGLWILDPNGKKLGRIIHGRPQTTNIAFGGPDWKTLYFTNANFLGSVNLKIAGVPVPSPKRS